MGRVVFLVTAINPSEPECPFFYKSIANCRQFRYIIGIPAGLKVKIPESRSLVFISNTRIIKRELLYVNRVFAMNLSSKKFRSLSIKDLLDAREAYHLHLMNKRNVVATAIGRYRFRKEPIEKNETGGVVEKEPKELDTTEVRQYSWPCVLVFVDNWVGENKFVPDDEAGDDGTKTAISDMVPKTLFLPDGREVPVCVIWARKGDSAKALIDYRNLVFPKNIIGGGYPVMTTVQEQDHLATIGCLVTDGHFTYALTNRHVSGEPGETLYTFLNGEKIQIGKSSKKRLTRKKFHDVYTTWPGAEVYLNLDIGLIEIDDLNTWTAQIYGIGTPGEMVDLSDHTISLDLIGRKVHAFGCASRQMRGEILGLFYRYKALGGYEYVADFLIGKRNDEDDTPFYTNHGDSASVWMLEKGNRPIAVQWGGHVFLNNTETVKSRYALATCLSTVCNLLELDFVRDLNIGLDEYWGGMGHYTIGNYACSIIRNSNLQQLMQANQNRISFRQADVTDKNITGLSTKPFIPLADVADYAWKTGTAWRGNEGPNHFADMDKPDSNNRTLLQICEDPREVTVDVWKAYYTEVKDKSRGLLPFRVWQIYNAMVEYIKQGKACEFVCAAGVLAHYVGDCGNPMHISYMYDGDPSDSEKVLEKNPKTHQMEEVDKPRARGIHSAYENDVLKYHMTEIIVALNTRADDNVPLDTIQGGNAAAIAMVELMRSTYTTLPPQELIDVYNTIDDKKQRQVAADILWDHFKDQTVTVLFDACRYLALLWESAWEEGDGDTTMNNLGEIDQDALKALYMDKTFLPSYTLNKISPALK